MDIIADVLPGEDRSIRLGYAYMALKALYEAGWALVPREATPEMLAAADSAIPRFEPDENGHRLMGVDGAADAFSAMLDAGEWKP